MATTRKLKLEFSMNSGVKKTYVLNEPKESLTLAEITPVANLFTRETNNPVLVDGVKPESFIRAYYEETTVTDIE